MGEGLAIVERVIDPPLGFDLAVVVRRYPIGAQRSDRVTACRSAVLEPIVLLLMLWGVPSVVLHRLWRSRTVVKKLVELA